MKNKRFNKNELSTFRSMLKEGFKESKEELATLKGLIADQKEYIKNSEMNYDADASKIRNREMLKNMKRRTKAKVKDFEAAMKKLKNGSYGICEASGKKISKERLLAMPQVKTRNLRK